MFLFSLIFLLEFKNIFHLFFIDKKDSPMHETLANAGFQRKVYCMQPYLQVTYQQFYRCVKASLRLFFIDYKKKWK